MFCTPGGLRACSVLSSRKASVRSVQNGYIIDEGTWSFNSGIYRQIELSGIPLVDSAGNVVDQGLAAVPIEQVQILNDWDAIALRGSGSSSVAVRNLFVPAERVVSIQAAIHGRYASTFSRGDALYRVAFIHFVSNHIGVSSARSGTCGAGDLLEKLPDRGIQYTWYENQAEATVTHLQVAEASAKIDAAGLTGTVERAVNDLDRSAESNGEYMDPLSRARIRRDVGFASQLICEAVDVLVCSLRGIPCVCIKSYEPPLAGCPSRKHLHGAVCTTTNLELYGRLLCGQPANTALI